MVVVAGLWMSLVLFLLGAFIERRKWKKKINDVFADADLFVESQLSKSGIGCMKLLDRDEVIVLFKNVFGSYSAASLATHEAQYSPLLFDIGRRGVCDQLDGGETPLLALHNLSERRLKTGPYAKRPLQPSAVKIKKPIYLYVWVSCDICLKQWAAPTWGKPIEELGSADCPSCGHPCDLRNIKTDDQDDPDQSSGVC